MENWVLVFDFGNTLLRDFIEYTGPMSSWPKIEPVAGIQTILPGLHAQNKLAVATNASDSDEQLVREALQKVGLDHYFSYIFCAKDLGVSKPEPGFFQVIIDSMGSSVQQSVMIGDSYPMDVIGAKQEGLRAIYYNPQRNEIPNGHPQYDAEIFAMMDLPSALEKQFYPDISECISWLVEQKATPGLIAHSQSVAAAAYRLAVSLRGAGVEVDPLLAHRGGLLHDLDKLAYYGSREQHGEMSARLLNKRNQPELAEIARRHLLYDFRDPHAGPKTREQELVFLADKMVEGDQVVGVKTRMNALTRRYPQYAWRFHQFRPILDQMESKICERLGLTQAALYERLISS